MRAARDRGEVDEAVLYWGQSAALIESVVSAREAIDAIVREAEAIIRERLPNVLSD